MSARANRLFEYVAHIMCDDGHTIEKAGTMEALSQKHVYSILSQQAADEGGWLSANHIKEVGDADNDWIEGEATEVKCLPAPPVEDAGVPDEKAADAEVIFGNKEYFLPSKGVKPTASMVTFKETA